MAVGASLTSAAGILSLLKESEDEIKAFALKRLDQLVDVFWAEIAESISGIEELSERKDFVERELACLVASKVFYHLGSFEDSLNFALGAGPQFDVNGTSEYIETIISQCIDRYTELKVKQFDGLLEEGREIDPRLETIVDRMFVRCLADKRYNQAVGISFETRRIDILEQVIRRADDTEGVLAYCLKVALSLTSSRRFRNEVLQVLVQTYEQLNSPDYISVCQCYIFLDNPQSTAQVLETLARGSKDDALVAYQIAFDLYESATQDFLRKVQEAIRGSMPAPPPAPPTTEKAAILATPVQETGEATTSAEVGQVTESEAMETEQSTNPEPPTKSHDQSGELDPEWVGHLKSVDRILGGEMTVRFHQEFLIRNNHTDLQILKNIKEVSRHSIVHNATVIANGLMHFGTTSDVFLRENLDWLKQASNWAKFTATASLGLIHYGHEKEALNLMASYLPRDSSGSSPYAEGGGLYAIGLIHANHGLNMMDYLSKELRNTSEVVRHGGCLGLGLAAMGTANLDAYEQLKENLMTRDDAVIGEAAGLAMGLVMIGTRNEMAIEDMVNYARDTQHEKIQRGLSLGVAMLMYGQLEEADSMIEDLCRDKDPLLRRCGMFTIAMAYCGSGNNKAIRKLLHVAVSDVDDNVRRTAVTCLGFILFRSPEHCPHVVSLLSESFNPHVRAGSALALGIACASSGNKEALSLIEPMLSDSVPFVQQSALVASAMILIQHTPVMSSKVTFYKQHYAKVVSDKHEHNLVKLGAVIAQGIINAGGCNVTISLQSRTGHMSMRTAVGLMVFSQFWFWYPLSLFLSLALTPTAIIGLNADLKMPKLEFRSSMKPSMYAYPAPLEKEKEKFKEKVEAAVLSVTAKAKAKLQKKAAARAVSVSEEAMDTDKPPTSSSEVKMDTAETAESAATAEKVEKVETVKEEKTVEAPKDEKMDTGEVKEKKAEPEPDFQMLSNPARVLPQQLKVLSLEESSRYKPLKPMSVGGIIMLRDGSDGTSPEELIAPIKVPLPATCTCRMILVILSLYMA
ncbi:26S proteasome non-ATPase regulatory subunit 1-like isoform X2 [Halichondria panicea]|uniref:26S proteasome non-ATPase regulatory subunit 1-like isoform X2 n=1 Tax=Halichondria panicea TaxID=6063 RepID=UPI00312BB44A